MKFQSGSSKFPEEGCYLLRKGIDFVIAELQALKQFHFLYKFHIEGKSGAHSFVQRMST